MTTHYLFVVIATSKCRLLYSSHLPALCHSRHAEPCRGSQSVSAFQTTFYSAVPLPAMSADVDVFRTLVPYRHHHHCHYPTVPDSLEISSSTVVRDDSVECCQLRADVSPGAVVVGNGRCPAVDVVEDYGRTQPRQRQQCRQGWSARAAVLLRSVEGVFLPGSIVALHVVEDYGRTQPRQRQQCRQGRSARAAVLLRAVEGLFLPGSVVALLMAVAAVLCVDAAAVALDSVVRTLVDVRALEALLDRGIEDSAASVDAFSDFVNAELTSPLCVDLVHLDVLKLTSLLHHNRFNVEGTRKSRKTPIICL